MRIRGSNVVKVVIVCVCFFAVYHLYWDEISQMSKSRSGLLPDSLLDSNQGRKSKFGDEINFPHIPGMEVDVKHGGVKTFEKDIQQQIVPIAKDPEDRKKVDVSHLRPTLNWRVPGNYELELPTHRGPGEYGVAVSHTSEEKDAVDAAIKEFGFNMVNSDKISMDRYPKDLRHQECKHWNYAPAKDLPTVSVVIVFHNEGWSTLMRTIHSVVNFTPKELLAEVVMIDDRSNKEHLKKRLEDYIQRWDGLVKLFRNERREGLIRARSIGAKKASAGKVLVYLDAHCECGYNWLPPLITPIAMNRMVTTVPLIDVISGRDYTFTGQAGGNLDGFARGAWDWSMLWKRTPITKEEIKRREHKTDPYRSPAMAGGLFAIERDYFFEIGLYDPGLEIWGGENFELSYKIWMCGGEVLFVPCSRVGHIYRLPGWSGNPPPDYVPSNPSLRNYIRVVETWWDEYKEYFYASRPETINMPYGDISEQVKYRRDHNCKSFKWFIENIAYDIPEHYPLPAKNKEWGEIRAIGTKECLDSMGHKNGDGAVEHGYCHRMGGNQLFRLSDANQLAQYDQCVTSKRGMITLVHCDTTEYKEWDHDEENKAIRHTPSGKCLDRGELVHTVFLSPCNGSKTQQWEINQVGS
ncbi:N-acetylgalactosaminyltransferase 7-like [Styela clava]